MEIGAKSRVNKVYFCLSGSGLAFASGDQKNVIKKRCSPECWETRIPFYPERSTVTTNDHKIISDHKKAFFNPKRATKSALIHYGLLFRWNNIHCGWKLTKKGSTNEPNNANIWTPYLVSLARHAPSKLQARAAVQKNYCCPVHF